MVWKTAFYLPDEGILALQTVPFDGDDVSSIAHQVCQHIGAQVIESESSGDLHTFLIDFEGCRLLLKGEHYSQSVWIEALDLAGHENLAFLHSWLSPSDKTRQVEHF